MRVERGALASLAATLAEAQRLLADAASEEDDGPRSELTLLPAWAPRGRA